MAHIVGKFKHSLESKSKISQKLKGTKCGGFNVFHNCKHCGKSMNAANFARHEKACLSNISYKRLFKSAITSRKFKAFKQRLRILYKITIEQYAEMFDKQNGKCFLCHKENTRNTLCVDHCHSTQKVRGLLCDNCNLMIGLAKDDVEVFKRAIQYLQSL